MERFFTSMVLLDISLATRLTVHLLSSYLFMYSVTIIHDV